MRCRLVEEPVLYRTDLSDAEWSELRRRLGEEERLLDAMFGLVLEVRAEGVAGVDPSGTLSERRLPGAGTVGHAALLLIEALHAREAEAVEWEDVVRTLRELAETHRRRWAGELVESPERLAGRVTALLIDLRLLDEREHLLFRLLPAAGRFLPKGGEGSPADAQAPLW